MQSPFLDTPFKIELQPAELLQCETSASNILKQYVREEYMFNKRFKRVLIGRKGEYAVAKFFKREFDNRLLRSGDGGVDICLDDWTIQVKTTKNPKYDLMVSKTEDIVADYFVHCLIEESNVVQIKGYIDHINFLKFSREKPIDGKQCLLCPSNVLKPIGYLKGSFYFEKFPSLFQEYVMQYANGINFSYDYSEIDNELNTKKVA